MDTFSCLAALVLLAAPTQPQSVPPTQRPEDVPAHTSPYSTFGQPHARRPASKRPSARLQCNDGTIRKGTAKVCDGHGGVKR